MAYLEPLPQWEAPGVEPPSQLKNDGWRYTQRPPASYFDWFFFTVYYALKELQEEAIHQERIEDGVTSTSTTDVASANAVKTAYDRAVSAENTAKAYTDAELAALVDSAPAALDTLNELAQALNDDPNFSATITALIGAKYTKPETGIPLSDLASAVADVINSVSGKYVKPETGIPVTDLASAVQISLGKADSAVQTIPTASTSTAGIVQLNDSTDSTSTTEAATANAINEVRMMITHCSTYYGVATGANDKVVTVSPAPPALDDGLGIAFKNVTTNGAGDVTLNVNGLGAKEVVHDSLTSLTAGNLNAGSIYTVRYNADSEVFILQ